MKCWVALATAEGAWGPERTENFLRKLRTQKLIWGRGHSAGHSLLLAGEFSIDAENYIHKFLQSQEQGAPVDWVKANPVVIAGPAITIQRNAPHPNAARLFLEWQFSSQGLKLYEKVTGRGVAFPGAGTQQAKALEGLNLVYRTEETVVKVAELGLIDRFSKVAGLTQ